MANPVLQNRYELQQQLSQKAGRRTVLARDLQTDRPVVIKFLTFGSEVEWDDLKLFEREAETLQSLSHPALPSYLDYFQLDLRNGQRSYVMVQTYIQGTSLSKFLQGLPILTEVELKQLAQALLGILIYLHGQNPPIIHRDIKPSNILLTDYQVGQISGVHLIDFGSVQNFVQRDNSSFTVVGTYGYTPPEQLGGRATIASDLYSLGATLVALASGNHPSSLPQTGMRIDVDQVVAMSPGFVQWLKNLTEPRLERRVGSARQALDTLLALDRPEPAESIMPEPLLVTKPAGSKITLNRTGEMLEVLIPGLSNRLRLCVEQDVISLTNEVLGLKFKQIPPTARREIARIETVYSRLYQTCRLNIYLVNQGTVLGADLPINESELHWLACEVGSFLRLPIAEI